MTPGKYDEAFKIFKSIDEEDVAAMRNEGLMLRKGLGTQKDPKAAEDMLARAADAGLPTAQYDLAEMLMNGEAGKPDPKSALPWLTQAAAAHHPIAEYRLGRFYEEGTVVEKDLDFARTLYTQAAAAGVPDARERLVALGGSVPGGPPAGGQALTGQIAYLYCRRGRSIPARPGEFMRDPYEILGVTKSASEAEIKKAFRNLAKKHHPDTHAGDKNAQKKFQEISGAYDIVGDKEKRAKFDCRRDRRGGQSARLRSAPGRRFPSGRTAAAARARAISISPGTIRAGRRKASARRTSSPTCSADAARRGRQQPARGEDFTVATTISFDEAARGGTRRVVVPNGEQIDVKIPVGVKDGQQVRIKGRGGAGRNGGPPGDILIQIAVAPHPTMAREGNDIRMDLPVTLKEAVLGGKVSVPTLTGTVALSVPPNSNTGTTLRLKGKGIAPPNAAAGDLYVKLVVTLPEKPDADLTKFAEDWKPDYDPRAKMK